MPDLVTLGELCAVFVAKEIGRMRYCRDYTLYPGGAEATVAAGVKKLGFESGWISRLGEDELGYYLLNLLRGEGVDVSCVRMSADWPTGVFIRERLPRGEARHFYYRRDSACAHLSEEDIEEKYIASARILHLTGITLALSDHCLAAARRARDIAKSNGVKISFDPNLRLKLWKREKAVEIIEEFMRAADYVLPGLEDMRMLYGNLLSKEEVLLRLKKMGCRQIILKTGEKGAVVFSEGREEFIPARTVSMPVDLMGAGDAFAAGFIAGLLKKWDPFTSARLGHDVAYLSVQMPGNIESLPTWAEVDRFEKGTTEWKR